MARFYPRTIVLMAAIVAATGMGHIADASATPTAEPAASCATNAYDYAGLSSNQPAHGIEASVTALAASDVPNGHVAGWIGVGGTDAGPNGEAEWLQTGVNTQAGTGSELYAEITRLGRSPQYVTLASGVAPGTSYQLAVQTLPGRPNVWQVLVNGQPATSPIYLPGSSNFAPMATSESWDGGTPGCNGFAYRFDHLQISTGGSWQPMTNTSVFSDKGYEVTDRTKAGFTAMSA